MSIIKKIKTPRVLFPLFMSFMMTACMSLVLTIINIGFVENFGLIWIKSFAIGFCVAFPVAFFIAPLAHKFVNKICK